MPKQSTTALLVFTTVAKKSDAEKITKVLLQKKLAACVTTLPPAESRYVWKGKLYNEKELVLMIKTLKSKYPQLEKALKAVHPYECPEIVGVPMAKVFAPYHRWLRDSVTD